jgi:hypothetical protein
MRRDQYNFEARLQLFRHLQQFYPVDYRHPDIGQQQVPPVGSQPIQGRLTILDCRDIVPFFFQFELEHTPQRRVVVGQKYPHR